VVLFRLEQWEPGESRGSRRVLRAAEGEVPSADSPDLQVWVNRNTIFVVRGHAADRKQYRCIFLLLE